MATPGRLRYRGFQPDPFTGRLYGVGGGYSGEIDNSINGSSAYRSSPVQIGSLGDWKLGRAAYDTSLLLRSNKYFAFGTGMPFGPGYQARSSPVQIGGEADWTSVQGAVDNSGGGCPCAGIRAGKLFTWGRNNYGQLGLGHQTDLSSPVQVGSETDWTCISVGNSGMAGIRSGKIFVWGINWYANCGVSSATNSFSSPVQVGAITNWTSVSTAAWGLHALRDGKLYGWGYNGTGEIGIGTNDNSEHDTPTQVGTFDDWIVVEHGQMSCYGIRKPGRLYAWGWNNIGQLGLDNQVSYSSPVQIGSGKDWSRVSAGGYTGGAGFTAAIRSGKLYGWGYNWNGQLGFGNNVSPSSPVQVGSETDWLDVSCGHGHVLAIRHT